MSSSGPFFSDESTDEGLDFSGSNFRFQRKENSEANRWIVFGMRLGVTSALHPFEYAKVLIQLGYEPVAPRPGRTFLGNPVLVLPNIFKYVGYIKRTDGFFGCFVGLTPKLLGNIVAIFGSAKIAKHLGFEEVAVADSKSNDLKTDMDFYDDFKRQLSHDVVLQVSALCLTQPFHVVSVRMMAQFVGQETTYRSVTQSFYEIWSTEGILGLFSGLPAKLVCDISCLVLSSTTIYLIQKYMTERKSNGQVNAFVQFVWSSVMYPMQVVATCMAVTGSKLALGNPPHMKVYSSWMGCYNDLSVAGDLKRGSSLFFRYQKPSVSNYKMTSMPSFN